MLEQPLWRIARHRHLYPIAKRLAAEIPIARKDILDMAAVIERHLETRPALVSEKMTVADFVAAYTLDTASVVHLLEAVPNLRACMERMYALHGPRHRSASHRRSRASAAEAPARG